jgi:DNA ligase-1
MSAAATQVLLAETWSEDINPTGWWMSEKLDGVRCVNKTEYFSFQRLFDYRAYWNGSNFYSRQGNLFHAPDFFKAKLPKTPLDGEIW